MGLVPAGRLDRRITLQQRTVTQGAAGGISEAWADFVTVWAEKKDTRAGEFIAAQQVNAQLTSVFRIRFLSGVHPAMRISCDGKLYDILGVTELGRKRFLEITAQAQVQESEINP